MRSNDHPVVFEFGVERYEIAAVPEEVEQPRPDVGHYHLGVESECLPVGEIIPKADPWVHSGDASNIIEMLLEPDTHTLAPPAGRRRSRLADCGSVSVDRR